MLLCSEYQYVYLVVSVLKCPIHLLHRLYKVSLQHFWSSVIF